MASALGIIAQLQHGRWRESDPSVDEPPAGGRCRSVAGAETARGKSKMLWDRGGRS